MASRYSITAQQEREWIIGLHAGRREVFRVVFDTYRPLLLHFACIWISRDIADDIVQDVMFDLWQRRDALDAEAGHLSAYLFSAVRNRAANHRRHQQVTRRMQESEAAVVAPPAMSTPAPAADADAIVGDLQSTVQQALANLPEAQRAVLMLRWTQQMSYAEIGEVLAISSNTAMQHASRARKALSPFLHWLLGEIE